MNADDLVNDGVDILAVGAHPDDVELGCGGTLILSASAGLRVAAVDLSIGEMSTLGSSADRERERHDAADMLGLCCRPCLGLPDTRLGSDRSHVEALAGLIRSLAPGVVLAPYTEDRHPDHAAAGRLAREACFLSGLAKSGQGAAHRPRHLFNYMIHYPFTPSFIVDVSAVWTNKMGAVMAHASQFGGAAVGSAGLLAMLEARAAVHGAMIGAGRGEAFFSLGPVPLSGLPGLNRRPDGEGNPAGYQVFL